MSWIIISVVISIVNYAAVNIGVQCLCKMVILFHLDEW